MTRRVRTGHMATPDIVQRWARGTAHRERVVLWICVRDSKGLFSRTFLKISAAAAALDTNSLPPHPHTLHTPNPQNCQNVQKLSTTFGSNWTPNAPEIFCLAFDWGGEFVFPRCVSTQSAQKLMGNAYLYAKQDSVCGFMVQVPVCNCVLL